MIIDFYSHFGSEPDLDQCYSADSLSDLVGAADIDLAVAANLGDAFGNERAYCDLMPANIIRFAGLSPESDLCAIDSSFKGVRIYPTYQVWNFAGPAAANLISLARKHHLIIQVCLRIQDSRALLQEISAADVIGQLENIARANEDVKFVISGANCSEILGSAQFFQQKNIWADVSHVQHPTSSLMKLIDAVGSSRLLFGSGAPVLYPYVGVFRILNSPISIEDRERILEGNAKELLEDAR